MSTGSGIGGVIGAIIGFVIGTIYPVIGNLFGAYIGFMVGFGVGYAIDPIQADISQPGVPIQQLQIPDNTVGAVIVDVLGTVKVSGTFLCFGLEKATPQYTKSGGKGGSSQKVLTGYKYYMSWAQGICLGPVDTLHAIYKNNDEKLWSGTLNRPESGGKETISIPDYGSITFYFGTDDQIADSTIARIIGESSLNSPFRGLCYAVMNNFYIGEFNRCPAIKFIVQKSPVIAELPENNTIGYFDYNPAHALWYIFNNMTGLPATWLDITTFAEVAATLKTEELGISICFDQYQTALTYLEGINAHADNIIKYGNDGKFHLKLMRGDYDIETLPLIDENIMLDNPTLSRKSWIDTINEIKVQYSEIYEV